MLKLLDKFEEITASALLAAMSVVIIVQVVFRYFISYSLDWPEELGRFLFIASVFIGTSYAEQKGKHLSVTILRSSGGAWCKKYLKYVAEIITMLFGALMTVWGVKMVFFVESTNQVAPALQFPMWMLYAVVPLGMFCMTIRSFQRLVAMKRNDAESIVKRS
ncbi:MAG: TRAP transporter small permease [Mailhella sp.]|nr:TRAP transporter small permease [Mailhella sp.]